MVDPVAENRPTTGGAVSIDVTRFTRVTAFAID